MIRPATPADVEAIRDIYAHHVESGTGTFEEEPPTLEAMAGRMRDVAARGLPWLVDDVDGVIRGFAYASPFRLRSAYRYTAEDSVYVSETYRGRGVGKALLSALVDACRGLGIREVLAVIGDSANAGSVGVHRSCGFHMVGTAQGVGYKHGRFLDVVFMQLSLDSDAGAPGWEGLTL